MNFDNRLLNLQPYYNNRCMCELKRLNDGEEAENILVTQDTIFLGIDKMQIKKLDGTIEKYKISKYYPVDEKDKKINELSKKIEELEDKLNEHNKHDKSNNEIRESITNDDGNTSTKSENISN